MVKHAPNVTYSGPFVATVSKGGTVIHYTGTTHALKIALLSDCLIEGRTDESTDIIDKLDLNSDKEVLFRKNLKAVDSSPVSDELKQVVKKFQVNVAEMAALNRSMAPQFSEQTIRRLVYANIITILETLLSEYLIATVRTDGEVLGRFLETEPVGASRKSKRTKQESITPTETIVKQLESASFHNPRTVKGNYAIAFDKEVIFPESVNDAVEVRHDIVHRSGSKIGEEHPVKIKRDHIHTLILDAQAFVIKILDDLSQH